MRSQLQNAYRHRNRLHLYHATFNYSHAFAANCSAKQEQIPFFLDGRSAAKVLGRPHETVASWLRALRRVGVIALEAKGRLRFASRYRYIAVQ
jgi:hypothetical protein